ncbi:MAG: hypothetical protein ACXWVR_08145, partial [Rhodoplanes sp.]
MSVSLHSARSGAGAQTQGPSPTSGNKGRRKRPRRLRDLRQREQFVPAADTAQRVHAERDE